MTSEEQIKVAAVIATSCAVLVTVLLFVIREYLDLRARRRRACKALILYGFAAQSYVESARNSVLPFAMKDVIDIAQEVLYLKDAFEIVSTIDRSLSSAQQASAANTQITSSVRNEFINSLKKSITGLAKEAKVKLPQRL